MYSVAQNIFYQYCLAQLAIRDINPNYTFNAEVYFDSDYSYSRYASYSENHRWKSQTRYFQERMFGIDNDVYIELLDAMHRGFVSRLPSSGYSSINSEKQYLCREYLPGTG